VALERAEEARAALADLFPSGWEERQGEDWLELAVYARPQAGERLRRAFGEVRESAIADDWSERWRRFHRPVRVGPLWVGPPWLVPPADALPVVIDPGQAFGTGAHPTTRLCLELLLEQPRMSVADLGCGSGVLAVAAARLGFSRVVAVDHDVAAVEAARANAAANGAEIEIRQADVLAEPLPEAELGLANIELGLAGAIAGRFAGRRLITSGYLATEAPRARGWRRLDRRRLDGWAAELLERVG
jgi:ribosomal protein L11 methyltransferase